MKLISCGIFDKTYIYFFIIYFFLVMLFVFVWTAFNEPVDYDYDYNILLNMLSQYIGQIFCFIPEVIINKFFFQTKRKTK